MSASNKRASLLCQGVIYTCKKNYRTDFERANEVQNDITGAHLIKRYRSYLLCHFKF